MNGTIPFDQLANLGAGAIVVVALYIIYMILQAGLGGFAKLNASQTAASAQSAQAMSLAFTESVRTLKDAQEGQRLFYTSKLDEVRGEVAALHKRVRELEAENDSKDQRITDQAARITELERENAELKEEAAHLKEEVARLQQSFPKSASTKPKTKRGKNENTSKTVGGGARISGDK